MKFQIAGLPRSGTAWVASVLNLCPDVICVHEPPDLNVPVPVGLYHHCGESGSHLLVPDYRDEPADLRIFLKRNERHCYNSTNILFDDAMTRDSWLETLIPLAHEYERKSDIAIEFDQLFRIEAVKYIWNEISDSRFDEDKVSLLLNMNIQRESLEYKFSPKFANSLKH
jgi:hypothetical protein